MKGKKSNLLALHFFFRLKYRLFFALVCFLFFQKNFSPLFGAEQNGTEGDNVRKNSLINTTTRIRRYLMMVRKTPFAALFDIKGLLIQEEERKEFILYNKNLSKILIKKMTKDISIP